MSHPGENNAGKFPSQIKSNEKPVGPLEPLYNGNLYCSMCLLGGWQITLFFPRPTFWKQNPGTMARPHMFTYKQNLAATHSQGTASHGEHIHQSPPPPPLWAAVINSAVQYAHCLSSGCALSVRGSACHCVWLFVLQRLNGVTSLSGRSVRCSQCPMLSAIVSAPNGCSPSRTQALLKFGYWAGVALMLKETPFLFPHLLSLTVIFFPPFRFREVNGFGVLVGIQRKRYLCSLRPSSGCIRCPDRDLYFVSCEWGGEVMSQDESCSRVGSRCCYSCHWERRDKTKRKVSIFKPYSFCLCFSFWEQAPEIWLTADRSPLRSP